MELFVQVMNCSLSEVSFYIVGVQFQTLVSILQSHRELQEFDISSTSVSIETFIGGVSSQTFSEFFHGIWEISFLEKFISNGLMFLSFDGVKVSPGLIIFHLLFCLFESIFDGGIIVF